MFGRRFRLLRVFGFDIKADISWFFLALIVVVSLGAGTFPRYYPEMSLSSYIGMGAIGALGLFASILLHELAHSIVGRRFQMPVREITLFMFGGVAHLEKEPESAKAEFFMAIAGPALSVLLGFAFAALFQLGAQLGWSSFYQGVTLYLSQINFILAAFNLTPAFPMDGGRVLRAALWAWRKDLRWATRVASTAGTIFGYFLIFSGVLQLVLEAQLGGLWTLFIGMFLVVVAKASYSQLVLRQALQGRRISSFMNPEPLLCTTETPLKRIMNYLLYDFELGAVPVVGNDGKLVGCVFAESVARVPEQEWSRRVAGDFMSECPPGIIVDVSVSAEECVRRMVKSGRPWLFVTDQQYLVGTVSLAAITRYLSLVKSPDAALREAYT